MNEIWKDIEGLNEYQVSNLGRVRSLKFGKERILKPNISNGYPYVFFRKNGRAINRSVHRMVAEAFIPNPDNKPEINHINTIRDDNRVENLEWCTKSENMLNPLTLTRKSGDNHPKPMLGKSGLFAINTKHIVQLTKDGKLLYWWFSLTEASKHTGIMSSNISSCCTGRANSAGGYVFRYADEYLAEWWDKDYMYYQF